MASSIVRVAQFQVLDTAPEAQKGEGVDSEPLETLETPVSDSSVSVLENADSFVWQAQKEGQDIVFTGIVPSAAAQSLIAVTTGGEISDDTEVGVGAPDGFLVDALTGLDALATLESGALRYEDDSWMLEGTLAAGRERDDLEGVLARAATPFDAWTLEILPTRPGDNRAAGMEATAERPSPSDPGAAVDADAGEGSSEAQPSALPEAEPVAEVSETEEVAGDGIAASTADTSESAAGEQTDSALGEPADGVTTAQSEATAEIAAPDPEYRFSALKGPDGALSLRGSVPDPSTQALVMRLAGTDGQSALAVNPRAPQDFVSALYAGLAALDHLDQGQLAFANGGWLLTGRAAIDTQKDEGLAALAELGGEERFVTMVTAPPASAVCSAEVDAFMADKSLLFASGSANLTPDSRALLPDIAQLLNICPQTTVYVEGHTDSDGSEALNLPLSVARAEAVVDELVALGVSAPRLYAVGYGSSLPIASNDTIQGKRQNRRIAFTFEDAAQ
ncbi:OmpA family protein [Pelagibacterium xiamenense]|uniref:OmpA family protein n=1 Tax=Pelagibacterium xiamenense TaxID=2901140 RepID=UPI001E3773FA|nr:OmpA family protein [Pelagibacterium xiamenense]